MKSTYFVGTGKKEMKYFKREDMAIGTKQCYKRGEPGELLHRDHGSRIGLEIRHRLHHVLVGTGPWPVLVKYLRVWYQSLVCPGSPELHLRILCCSSCSGKGQIRTSVNENFFVF